MNNSSKVLIIIILFFVFIFKTACSQITSSPYSMFGLGLIEDNSLGFNKAMGGTGIALMSGYSLNFQNPASFDGIDSLVTIFELGIFGKYTSYENSKSNQGLFDCNIKYAVMGFRPSSRWATSFGIVPYSTIGYNIYVPVPIEGTLLTDNKRFSGDGGVNQLYSGNSYRITKNLVLGVNLVYLFGTVTHSESSNAYNFELDNVTYLSNFNLNYGLDYKFARRDWQYDIGVIYNHGKTLTTSTVETINTESETEELKSENTKYKIPESFGLGLAVGKNGFRGGVDFEYKKWKSVKFDNPLLKTRNSKRFSFGLEVPSSALSRHNSKLVLFRLGAEYSQSYLVINKVPINSRSISFGAGLPTKSAVSVLNVSIELGQNGDRLNNLFRENFYTLHLDLSLKDLWFVKRKYN
jgi:hypothetical protein